MIKKIIKVLLTILLILIIAVIHLSIFGVKTEKSNKIHLGTKDTHVTEGNMFFF